MNKIISFDDYNAAIGLFTEALRHDSEMTKSELAARSGISPSTITNIERGSPAMMYTIYRIAQALGYTIEQFTIAAFDIEEYTE